MRGLGGRAARALYVHRRAISDTTPEILSLEVVPFKWGHVRHISVGRDLHNKECAMHETASLPCPRPLLERQMDFSGRFVSVMVAFRVFDVASK